MTGQPQLVKTCPSNVTVNLASQSNYFTVIHWNRLIIWTLIGFAVKLYLGKFFSTVSKVITSISCIAEINNIRTEVTSLTIFPYANSRIGTFCFKLYSLITFSTKK